MQTHRGSPMQTQLVWEMAKAHARGQVEFRDLYTAVVAAFAQCGGGWARVGVPSEGLHHAIPHVESIQRLLQHVLAQPPGERHCAVDALLGRRVWRDITLLLGGFVQAWVWAVVVWCDKCHLTGTAALHSLLTSSLTPVAHDMQICVCSWRAGAATQLSGAPMIKPWKAGGDW